MLNKWNFSLRLMTKKLFFKIQSSRFIFCSCWALLFVRWNRKLCEWIWTSWELENLYLKQIQLGSIFIKGVVGSWSDSSNGARKRTSECPVMAWAQKDGDIWHNGGLIIRKRFFQNWHKKPCFFLFSSPCVLRPWGDWGQRWIFVRQLCIDTT